MQLPNCSRWIARIARVGLPELLALDCPNCSRWIAKSNAQQGGRGFGNLTEAKIIAQEVGTVWYHEMPENLNNG
jgi:hypothetical protein